MKKQTRKEKAYKVVALGLAFTMLGEMVAPTAAYALTGGPSQPEMDSFEPVGTSQMVDLFSGDFTYNIPLLTVPGPNGGYPINLAYHAGIGMEQEATWVGLGWNINAGSINRTLRGLPDDLSGELVKKEFTQKPNITSGVSFSNTTLDKAQFFGGDINLGKTRLYQMRVNSYKGAGFNYSRSRNFYNVTKKSDKLFSGFGLKSTLDFDTQDGIGYNPSISYQTLTTKDWNHRLYHLGIGWHSRAGVYSLGFSYQRTPHRLVMDRARGSATADAQYSALSNPSQGTGVRFSAGSYVPNIDNGMYGYNIALTIMTGSTVAAIYKGRNFGVFYSFEGIKHKTFDVPAYGYIFSDKRPKDADKALLDFNRQNQFPVNKDAPTLPVPVFSYDVYQVTGQGIGMTFRPYRSDVGVLYDQKMSNDFGSGSLGIETSPGDHLGAHVGTTYTHSYSGNWKDKWADLERFQFEPAEGNTDDNGEQESGLYQPYYFKAAGEQTADIMNDGETGRFFDENALRLRIGLAPATSLSFEPKVYNVNDNNSNTAIAYNIRKHRAPQSQLVEHNTRGQIEAGQNYANRGKYIVDDYNEFPGESGAVLSAYDFAATKNGVDVLQQLGEMSVLNPDGNRYEYGIPVYNLTQKDVIFSVGELSSFSRTISYSSTDASLNNAKGNDNLYSSTTLPPYAHSYLLTAIYSPDYVDLTGDGPTDDDLGYWVKFNYNKDNTNYKWRSPYHDAEYIQGYHSNPKDDKASYSYGERETWYLNSIETKTHIAEFTTSDRNDGAGADQEHNVTSFGARLRKLDKIALYSKADRNKVIKQVHFKYTYELCKNVVNNDNGTDAEALDANSNKGKLTLKKVFFTFADGENGKGSLSPYIFDYGSYNPDYNLQQMDRWGNYKPDDLISASAARNEEMPYVRQDSKTLADEYMASWNLHKITLPSGGTLQVDYESDDYAYVQDKEAMQVFEIAFTGDGTGDLGPTSDPYWQRIDNPGGSSRNRLYFNLEQQTHNVNDINKYIEGIDLLYFKTYMKLPRFDDPEAKGFTDAYDYVEGYCRIDKDNCGIDLTSNTGVGGAYTRGYISVEKVKVSSLNNIYEVNPIQKAAWEYLKMNRNDLLYPTSSIITNGGDTDGFSPYPTLLTLFRDLGKMLLGYYNFCNMQGLAREMYITPDHPSVIRLNSPDKIKFGGGHRVKKITVLDNWSVLTGTTGTAEQDFDYGQEFSYTTLDKNGATISSGVAAYEPLIGGEEIPQHLPTDKFTSSRRIIFNDKNFYLEGPICEAYYPGANVGYSRVVSRNLKREVSGVEINKNTAAGIAVSEFYTAKDFPVIDNKSTAVTHKGYSPTIIIPFIGTQEFDNHGYAQGYVVELNDMHGKPKAESTFAYNADINDPDKAITRTEYIYNTKNPYTDKNRNELFNLVTVLDGDGDYRQALLGQQTDFFIDMDQHSSYSLSAGLDPNLDNLKFPGGIVPSLWPSLSYDFSMYRAVVTMKVIQKTGIMVEARTRNQASLSVMKNLMFDSKTGEPLLTVVNNNFDEPVYSYAFRANWSYPGMEQAAANYGATIHSPCTVDASHFANYNTTIGYATPDMRDVFMVGDKVEVSLSGGNVYYWVDGVQSNGVRLKDEDGTLITPSLAVSNMRVVQSNRRNQTGISNGSLVSLKNPVTDRKFPLFDAFNTALGSGIPTDLTFTDCASGQSRTVYPFYNANVITFSTTSGSPCESGCCATITFDVDVQAIGIDNLRFYKRGKKVLAQQVNVGTPYPEYAGEWTDEDYCYPECMDDVLHAEAYRFADTWTFDYADYGNPVASYGGSTSSLASIVSGTHNPYRIGTKGVWRSESAYAYQVDRKQTTPATNIAKDGVYNNFVFYDWKTAVSNNPYWTYTSSVTKYNPFGYEVENKNALDIYSAALYGYNNSVPVATLSNGTYFETASDGFEDYNSNTYPAHPATGHGHLTLRHSGNATPTLTTTDAHTGNVSLALSSQVSYSAPVVAASGTNANIPASAQTAYSLVAGKKYTVTAWFKVTASGAVPQISATNGTNVSLHIMPQKIENWQRAELTFTAPASGSVIFNFYCTGGSGSELLDDVRIQPFQSAMKTFVYDPKTLWLLAELDNRNFATFYNYDAEGIVVQVKAETEKGIMTISTSRNNVKH